MKNETDKTFGGIAKKWYAVVRGPDTDVNSWAWRSAAINVSIFALTIVTSVALLTLLLEYVPLELRWTGIALVFILDGTIVLLMWGHSRVSIELKALDSLHKDVLGALSPDTAKILMTKWYNELRGVDPEPPE